jgi:hypothetical protein
VRSGFTFSNANGHTNLYAYAYTFCYIYTDAYSNSYADAYAEGYRATEASPDASASPVVKLTADHKIVFAPKAFVSQLPKAFASVVRRFRS